MYVIVEAGQTPFFNSAIANWLDADEIRDIRRQQQNRGICYFYEVVSRESKGDLEEHGTFASLLDLYRQKSVAASAPLVDDRRRLRFFVDFLKAEGYLESIPCLYQDHNKQTVCADYLITEPHSAGNIEIAPLVQHAIDESVKVAHSALREEYQFNPDEVLAQMKAGDPLYVRYLPYYFLMELFRTDIDSPDVGKTGEFQTIRRDKQFILNEVYNALLKKGILQFDQSSKEFQKVDRYFRYAWYPSKKVLPLLSMHVKNLHNEIMNEFMFNPNSEFHFEKMSNLNIRELCEKLQASDQGGEALSNTLYYFLSGNQPKLLKNTKANRETPGRRLLRNMLIEVQLNRVTISKEVTKAEKEYLERIEPTLKRIHSRGYLELDRENTSLGPETFRFLLAYLRSARDMVTCHAYSLDEDEQIKRTIWVAETKQLDELLRVAATQAGNDQSTGLHSALEKERRRTRDWPPQVELLHESTTEVFYRQRYKQNPPSETARHNFADKLVHDFDELEHAYLVSDGLRPAKVAAAELDLLTMEKSFPPRTSEAFAEKNDKMEWLRARLANPANYSLLFQAAASFEESVQPEGTLLKRFEKYQRHFEAMFEQLQNISSLEDQFAVLMNSYVVTGLLVRVALPQEWADGKKESVWCVEASWWQHKAERQRVKKIYEKKLASATAPYPKAVYQSWIQHLALPAGKANSLARSNRSAKKSA